MSLMTTRVTDRDDSALRTLLSDGALEEPFDYAYTELVVIGEEERVPVGFVSGQTLTLRGHRHATLEHIGIRPGFRGQGRVYALGDAFAEAQRARGFDHLITRLNPDLPSAEALHHILTRWGAQAYGTDGMGLVWYVKYLGVTQGVVPREAVQ